MVTSQDVVYDYESDLTGTGGLFICPIASIGYSNNSMGQIIKSFCFCAYVCVCLSVCDVQ